MASPAGAALASPGFAPAAGAAPPSAGAAAAPSAGVAAATSAVGSGSSARGGWIETTVALPLATDGIVTPSGKTGFVPAEALNPLGNDQLCYSKEGGGWKISGVIGGEQ